MEIFHQNSLHIVTQTGSKERETRFKIVHKGKMQDLISLFIPDAGLAQAFGAP